MEDEKETKDNWPEGKDRFWVGSGRQPVENAIKLRNDILNMRYGDYLKSGTNCTSVSRVLGGWIYSGPTYSFFVTYSDVMADANSSADGSLARAQQDPT